MENQEVPVNRIAFTSAAMLGVLVLTGCAGKSASVADASSSSTSTPHISTNPAAATGDPLATAPVPPAPPSKAFTWPKPSPPVVTPGLAPRGLKVNLAAVNRTNAGDVAKAFATIAYSSDTRTDTSPADAGRRAAPLATPELTKALKAAPPGRGGADWTDLVSAKGYTLVKTRVNTDGGAPAGTATTEYASYVVTITPKPTGAAQTVVVYLQITRTTPTGPWAVAQLRGAT
jgi:hypothetical protein